MEAKRSGSKRVLIGALLVAGVFLTLQVVAMEIRFIDNGDNTVTDKLMRLVWIKNTAEVPGIDSRLEWPEADQACRELVYAGLGPGTWRLPHIEELKTLIDKRFKNPQINTDYFICESAQYWSKTPYTDGLRAWIINYKNGMLGSYEKHNPDKPAEHFVRCVAQT